jgi:hypothetical protein
MPKRWNNRATRNLQPINEVLLNPPKEHINESINLKQAVKASHMKDRTSLLTSTDRTNKHNLVRSLHSL